MGAFALLTWNACYRSHGASECASLNPRMEVKIKTQPLEQVGHTGHLPGGN